MSAFKDAGHRGWMQCPSCGMAWPIAGAPDNGEGAEDECGLCKRGGEEGVAATARAEGYAAAREQAARLCESFLDPVEASPEAAAIRAMRDEVGR